MPLLNPPNVLTPNKSLYQKPMLQIISFVSCLLITSNGHSLMDHPTLLINHHHHHRYWTIICPAAALRPNTHAPTATNRPSLYHEHHGNADDAAAGNRGNTASDRTTRDSPVVPPLTKQPPSPMPTRSYATRRSPLLISCVLTKP